LQSLPGFSGKTHKLILEPGLFALQKKIPVKKRMVTLFSTYSSHTEGKSENSWQHQDTALKWGALHPKEVFHFHSISAGLPDF